MEFLIVLGCIMVILPVGAAVIATIRYENEFGCLRRQPEGRTSDFNFSRTL